MGDGEPGRVSRKAPRFFGLPDDAPEREPDELVDAGVATEAPTPVRPIATGRVAEALPPADPKAADTAELLVDPVARREVGEIVEARHLRADARELLRQQALRRAPQVRAVDGSDIASIDAAAPAVDAMTVEDD